MFFGGIVPIVAAIAAQEQQKQNKQRVKPIVVKQRVKPMVVYGKTHALSTFEKSILLTYGYKKGRKILRKLRRLKNGKERKT